MQVFMRAWLLVALLVPASAGAERLRIELTPSSTASPRNVAHVRGLFHRAADMLKGSGLPLPKGVHIALSDVLRLEPRNPALSGIAPNTRYGLGHMTLTLGAKTAAGARTSTQRQGDVISLHEFGHTIFEQALLRLAPRYRAAKQLTESKAELEASWDKTLDGLSKRFDAAKTDRERRALRATMKKKYRALQDRVSKAETMTSGIDPYHELFADAVATLYFRDGHAVRDAIDTTSPKLRNLLRDFSSSTSIATTRKLMDDPAHELGAPIRGFIWQTYQARSKEAVDPRPAMLASLAKHSAERFESRMRHGHAQIDDISVAGFNNALRARLLADPDFIGPAARR